MKKTLILFVCIISFFGINTVKADTTYTKDGIYLASDYYDNFDKVIESYNQYQENINYLIDYWENNASSVYSNYFVSFGFDSEENVHITIFSSNSSNLIFRTNYFTTEDWLDVYCNTCNGSSYTYGYSSETNEYIYSGLSMPSFLIHSNYFLVTSNIIPKFKQQEFRYSQSGSIYIENYSGFNFPSFTSSTTNFSVGEIEIKDGDNYPTLKSLLDGNYSINDSSSYKEINLNSYSYVALSLKDYTERETFYANTYVKGQYCLTPVYNYGMTEKNEIVTGSKTQRCSTYYDDFTLVRTYILDQDIENNAIYYLKAYDTSKENIVKIDTSIFDVTYITEENKDNPYVTISGKTYPTISYDNLTDTATKSEDEDYISGVSCQVGDFNCYNEYNPSNIFDELFDKPLEILKDVWNGITSIFDIIVQFISLLPETMQSFLYLSFIIALIFGLIKIIL